MKAVSSVNIGIIHKLVFRLQNYFSFLHFLSFECWTSTITIIYSVRGKWQTQNNIGILFITYLWHVSCHITYNNLPTTLHQPDVGHPPEPRSRSSLHLHSLFPMLWQQGAGMGYHHRLHRQRGKSQEQQQGQSFWRSSQALCSSLGYWHWWYWWQLVEWD